MTNSGPAAIRKTLADALDELFECERPACCELRRRVLSGGLFDEDTDRVRRGLVSQLPRIRHSVIWVLGEEPSDRVRTAGAKARAFLGIPMALSPLEIGEAKRERDTLQQRLHGVRRGLVEQFEDLQLLLGDPNCPHSVVALAKTIEGSLIEVQSALWTAGAATPLIGTDHRPPGLEKELLASLLTLKDAEDSTGEAEWLFRLLYPALDLSAEDAGDFKVREKKRLREALRTWRHKHGERVAHVLEEPGLLVPFPSLYGC